MSDTRSPPLIREFARAGTRGGASRGTRRPSGVLRRPLSTVAGKRANPRSRANPEGLRYDRTIGRLTSHVSASRKQPRVATRTRRYASLPDVSQASLGVDGTAGARGKAGKALGNYDIILTFPITEPPLSCGTCCHHRCTTTLRRHLVACCSNP